MAKSVATRESVFAAADQLVAANKDPSTLAVRHLCGGSNSTVQNHLKEWQEIRSRQAQTVATLPKALASQGEIFVSDLWASASRLAHAETEEIKERAAKEIGLAERRLNEVLQEIDRLQTAHEEKDSLIKTQAAKLRALELNLARLESATQRSIELEGFLALVQSELGTAQQQVAYWKGQAEYASSLVAALPK